MFYKETNLDQIITFKTPKLGPDNNTTAYIYIYICHIAFRPICCLLFLAETTCFALFRGKKKKI